MLPLETKGRSRRDENSEPVAAQHDDVIFFRLRGSSLCPVLKPDGDAKLNSCRRYTAAVNF